MSSHIDEAASAGSEATSSCAILTAARTGPSPAFTSRCMFVVLPQRVRDRIYDLLFHDYGSAAEGAIVRVNRQIRSETRSRYRIASTTHRLKMAVLRNIPPKTPTTSWEDRKRQEMAWAAEDEADEDFLFEDDQIEGEGGD